MEVLGAHAHIAFYLTGRQLSENINSVDDLSLRPALLARFKDMSEVRYDYPIILLDNKNDSTMIESLSNLIDKKLKEIEIGNEGDRIKKTVLQIEKEIRRILVSGRKDKFSKLWESASKKCISNSEKNFQDRIVEFGSTIEIEGDVVDCDENLPERLIRHIWEIAEKKKAEFFRKKINRLIVKLSDILTSDFEKSEKGRTAERLQNSIGGAHGELFDFNIMSGFLSKALPKETSSDSRHQRISELLSVLKSQKFFALTENEKDSPSNSFGFIFESCSTALETYLSRMPKVIELAKAIAIAELELDGHYIPKKHDILFEGYGANGLGSEELLLFPDYLVCMNTRKFPSNEYARLLQIISSDLPIKVMLQTDDILEEIQTKGGQYISGIKSKQLASMAIGLNEVYVLQSSNSNLFQFKGRILDGLRFNGPSIFSIYSGASEHSNLSPYLLSAAAMESRAFPAFTYDPSAGVNWASRFYLQANSQTDLDWPIQHFQYEDESHQRIIEDIAFTYIDFLACDKRYTKHFAHVSKSKWNGSLVPTDEFITMERKTFPDKVPNILMVDKDNYLQKVIVDESIVREAKRCRERWHSLQELGGIHNSHAEILLEREKKAWEARMHTEAEQQSEVVTKTMATIASNSTQEPEPERSKDEAYIDTPRCSTCNECITVNNKMFAYDNNKQAYIVDVKAGTYAQLVEAAENCKVSIIHPGKPMNPKEAGLDELLQRAEMFR